jgi:hypothetical protein
MTPPCTDLECTVDGCEKQRAVVMGYCQMHYNRYRKYGTTDLPPRKPRKPCGTPAARVRHTKAGEQWRDCPECSKPIARKDLTPGPKFRACDVDGRFTDLDAISPDLAAYIRARRARLTRRNKLRRMELRRLAITRRERLNQMSATLRGRARIRAMGRRAS